MFELEDVKLRFTDDALRGIAGEALKRSVGARGLRVILEEIMLDLMYTVPSQRDISECVITEETVVHRTQPITTLRKAG
jgi:ATP-dependent Clp protease ATP-binding subunit ClpX